MKKIHKTPTIYQMEAAECGVASLAMILAYYGKHIPLEQLRMDAGVSRDGSKAGNLIRAALKHGMEGHGYKMSFETLKSVQTPCIILFRRGHFVVLEGFCGRYSYVNDPAVGRRKLLIDELSESYAGVALTFHPTSAFQKEKASRNSGFLRKALGYQNGLIISVLFGVAASVFCFGAVLSSSRFIDNSFSESNRQISYHCGFTILLYLAAAVILWLMHSFYGNRYRASFLLRSEKLFTEKLFRLPVGFYEQRYTGEPVNRAKRNSAINRFITDHLAAALIGAVIAAMALGLLLMYSIRLSLLALVCVAIQIAVPFLLSRFVKDAYFDKLFAHENALAGKVYTGICEMETLKASGAEKLFVQSLAKSQKKLFKERQTITVIKRQMTLIRIALLLLALSALTAISMPMLYAHEITYGQTFSMLLLYVMLSQALNTIALTIEKAHTLKPSLSATEDVLQYPEDEIYNKNKSGLIRKAEGYVTLENVSFSYSELSPPVISDFTVSIKPGSSIAIVGSSGSGKSTVAKLISGVYRPQKGRITLDGQDLATIPKSVINTSISIVSQQPALFSGTIKDNITMWNSKIADKDIVAAAKDACILDCILERNGQFEAPVAENGVNFSGGQRRRLELARALATNPSVLVMDEVTAAVDTVTEQRIMDNIKRRGCTCVIIAHRLSAIKDCDMIVVLESGSIVQMGSHSDLAAVKGAFRSMLHDTGNEVTV